MNSRMQSKPISLAMVFIMYQEAHNFHCMLDNLFFLFFLSSGPKRIIVRKLEMHIGTVSFCIIVAATVMTHFTIYTYCDSINQHLICFPL